MAKNIDVLILFDIYGDILTQKQRDFLSYYYNDDLSLAEIAENEGITRQGVRDAIKRAESQLAEMESHLGLSQRFTDMKKSCDEILALVQVISEENAQTLRSEKIDNAVAKIGIVVKKICE